MILLKKDKRMKKTNDSTEAYLKHIISLYIKNANIISKTDKEENQLNGILKIKESK